MESRRHVATYRANANCWNQLTEKSRLDRVSLALTSNPFILDVLYVNSKSVECIIKSSVRYISYLMCLRLSISPRSNLGESSLTVDSSTSRPIVAPAHETPSQE